MLLSLEALIACLFGGAQMPTEPVIAAAEVAEIVEASGTVKLRPTSHSTWKKLGGTRILRSGDRLFTDKNSYVRIKYLKHEKTFVTLGEWMVLEVDKDPPLSSYLLKAIPSKDGELILPTNKSEKISDEDFLPFTDVADLGDHSSPVQKNSGQRSLEVEYPIEAVEARFPAGKLFYTGQSKAVASVVLPKEALSRGELYGTLWSLAPTKRPLWSIAVDTTHFSLPLDSEGEFLFTASTKDGHTRLRPVSILVTKSASSFFPTGVRRRDVVFAP